MTLLSVLFLPFFLVVCLHTADTTVESSVSSKDFITTQKCEQILGSSFTKSERHSICSSNASSSSRTSPYFSTCAAEVRKEFKLKFHFIYDFCQNSTSTLTLQVDCLRTLPPSDRLSYGILLCKPTSSAVSANCYKQLHAYASTTKLAKSRDTTSSHQQILSLCSSTTNDGVLQCHDAAITSMNLPLTTATQICQNASYDHQITSHCLLTLQPLITKKGKTTQGDNESLLKFCFDRDISLMKIECYR